MASLDGALTCAVCLDRYKQPKRLQCAHSFCTECLDGLTRAQTVLRCPVCRSETHLPESGVSGLHNDVKLTEIVQIENESENDNSTQCQVCGQNREVSLCSHCEGNVCRKCEVTHVHMLEGWIHAELRKIRNDGGNEFEELEDKLNAFIHVEDSIRGLDEEVDLAIDEQIALLQMRRQRLHSELGELRDENQNHIAHILDALSVREFHSEAKRILDGDPSESDLLALRQKCAEIVNSGDERANLAELQPSRVEFTYDTSLNDLVGRFGRIVRTEETNAVIIRGTEQDWTPYDVAICPRSDHLYIVDHEGSPYIYIYKTDGTNLRRIEVKEGRKNISIDFEGRIILSHLTHHCISVHDESGELFDFCSQGSEHGMLDRPCGLANDTENNIYVADCRNSRVEVFNPRGGWQRTLGDDILGQPMFVAVDENNDVYVTDGGAIFVFHGQGGHTVIRSSSAVTFVKLRGLSVDQRGHILVANNGANAVEVLDKVGRWKYRITHVDENPFQFLRGLTVTAKGNIVAADVHAKSVLIFTYEQFSYASGLTASSLECQPKEALLPPTLQLAQ